MAPGMRARRSSCRRPHATPSLDACSGRRVVRIGAALLGWFVLGLLTGHSFEKDSAHGAKATEVEERELVAQ